ncbi:integrin beta-4-like [Mercenaria mercenaria]|uniref:integrin beta-4-like n=1 Tax=Mercenaria mercenaria TaxID=6596 RepID=UPI00234EAE18|nr:integrin beta-4-like [Mercenaria mercenaria]
MFKAFIIVPFVVMLFLKTVTSHGGHNEGPQTKNAIQDALLSYLCRGSNGLPCNAHGSCSSGMCTCNRGYSGRTCEINDADISSFGQDGGTSGMNNNGGFNLHDLIPHHFTESPQGGHAGDTSGRDNNVGGFNLHDLIPPTTEPPQIVACLTNDENACSGHGYCHEGSCLCESGHSGIMCELSAELGFCRTYKDCAECMALMNDCPEKCSLMANFKLVFGFQRQRDGGTFRKCRFRNPVRNCTFYFRQESVSTQGMKTIAVKACMYYNEATTNTSDTVEQLKDKPLQPVTSPEPSTSSPDDQSNIGMDSQDTHDSHAHHDHGTMGDADHGTMGDAGKQNSNTKDSGTSFIKPEMLLVVGSILMLLQF